MRSPIPSSFVISLIFCLYFPGLWIGHGHSGVFPSLRRRTHGSFLCLHTTRREGVSKHNPKSKSKLEMSINKALIGPRVNHAPLRLLGCLGNERFTTQCQNQYVDSSKSKSISKPRAATIQRVLLGSAAWSKYHIMTAVDSLQPTANTAKQPHRPLLVNSQHANHSTSPDALGPLFPGVQAKANTGSGNLGMMPSRTRSELRSQDNSKFDPGALTLDTPPPPPWEPQRRPGTDLSSRLPASAGELCSRTLECPHLCGVENGPGRWGAIRCSSPGVLLSLERFDSVGHIAWFLSENRNINRFSISSF